MDEPKVSVIIPAYNVQGYLRQAVMSVALEDAVEVIVVDDCSTDGTAMLADELAARFGSVSVIRPPENVGLGRARNLGMREATGEYVLFLDGDDYFLEGAIDRVRMAIQEDTPDVVVFGYQRLYPDGDAVDGQQRQPLQVEGSFTAADNIEILDVLNVAWNKAYRRSYLGELGIKFPVGYYEDIPWSYPILVAAASIVGVDQPLYMYRQRWSGSILRSTDARHLEIVDQFDRLMATMDSLDTSDALRVEVFNRAFRNLVTLATNKRHRIPPAMRREFYANARRSVRDHAPAAYELPKDGDKWKLMRLVWSVNYELFAMRLRVVDTVVKVKSLVRGAKRLVKKAGRFLLHSEGYYEIYRRVTRLNSDLVVMENLWGLSPRLNCLAIDQEIRRTHPGMRIVWSINSKDVGKIPLGWEYAIRGSRKNYRVLASAKYFFLDVNLPAWWRKRPGQVFTQLHHGTPLKRMGVEELGKDRSWVTGLLARCQNWDYSVVSNSYSAEVWKHSYPVNCETLEYGYPRNDVLVDADGERVAAARRRVGIVARGRVLLYAPTFRERDSDAISAQDLDVIGEALDDGDVMLTRGHYFAGRERASEHRSAIVDVTEYPSIEDLYLAADILITDYSSSMFDYANLGRPIIIFAYDWEKYRVHRGTYFDISVDAPGAVTRTAGELAETLISGEYANVDNTGRLRRFRQIFCEFDNGHAARAVVERVIDGEPAREINRRGVPVLASWGMDRIA